MHPEDAPGLCIPISATASLPTHPDPTLDSSSRTSLALAGRRIRSGVSPHSRAVRSVGDSCTLPAGGEAWASNGDEEEGGEEAEVEGEEGVEGGLGC